MDETSILWPPIPLYALHSVASQSHNDNLAANVCKSPYFFVTKASVQTYSHVGGGEMNIFS